MAGKITKVLKSAKGKVISFFSPHERRLGLIENYTDKSVEISGEFRRYAKSFPEQVRKKCGRTRKCESFDLYGFNADWNAIDQQTIMEKIGLYRQFFNASADHSKKDIAAMTRLNEVRYELAAAQNQLDALYQKLLRQNTVYQRGPEESADDQTADDQTVDDDENVIPDTADGVI